MEKLQEIETQRMLSKEECQKARDTWKNIKLDIDYNYLKIKKIVDPKKVYVFVYDDIKWLKNQIHSHPLEANKDYFHVHLGVKNINNKDELIFIISPIKNSGEEDIDIDNYIIIKPTQLAETEKIILKEKVTTTTITTTTLSSKLEVTDIKEEIEKPFIAAPSISEKNILDRIQLWIDHYIDWLYFECVENEGKRIVATFTVPLGDLKNLLENNKAYCIFGFKTTFICNMQIPVLNFVIVDAGNIQQLKNTNASDGPVTVNTDDFGSPSPPFSNNKF